VPTVGVPPQVGVLVAAGGVGAFLVGAVVGESVVVALSFIIIVSTPVG